MSGPTSFELQQQKIIHELAKMVLANSGGFKWTLQGFGMFRTYLENGARLTMWHEKHRIPNVSMVHTHPWDFTSYIVCGMMRNQRYSQNDVRTPRALPFMRSLIKAGEGGGLEGSPKPVWLSPLQMENHFPRTFYCQNFDEIHASYPVSGTVTICDRVVTSPDGKDHAYVFWESGNQWVSAEPRPIEGWLVEETASIALAHLRALEEQ